MVGPSECGIAVVTADGKVRHRRRDATVACCNSIIAVETGRTVVGSGESEMNQLGKPDTISTSQHGEGCRGRHGLEEGHRLPRRQRGPLAVSFARLTAAVAVTLSLAATAYGQARTDVVSLANGDRLTGEVIALERGRLEFATDDAGTLYLEWDKLVSVVSKRVVEVVLGDGRRFLGSLGSAPSRSIAVVTPDGVVSLQMPVVTFIRSIGGSFWRRLDGSIDAGFNSTRSSGIAQLNLHSDTVFRQFASQTRFTASLTVTQTDDEEGRDDRGTIEVSYRRFPWQKVFIAAAGRFETNESLGLVLRSQVGAAVGPRLVNSNRGQLAIGGGLALNDERGVDVEPTQNVEALAMFTSSFYTHDRPKTNFDFGFEYYPSLSNPGRQRLQLDASIKREFWKDLFVSFNLYNSYDNQPPNPSADTNDVGLVLTIGWTY